MAARVSAATARSPTTFARTCTRVAGQIGKECFFDIHEPHGARIGARGNGSLGGFALDVLQSFAHDLAVVGDDAIDFRAYLSDGGADGVRDRRRAPA